ncbi:MAG: hypothetical protein HY551_08380 [Elusimicrobia bacterium]|nr:hypothetical protein [Elusimicrobiota bacterium]
MRRSSPGFTVAELLLVVLLGALVLLGLASLFSSTYRFMEQGHARDRFLAEAAMSMKSISRDLHETTVLYEPASGCIGAGGACDRLLGCTNWDDTLGARIDPRGSVPIRCYQYCVNSSGELWYTFQNGPAVHPPSGSPSSCATTWSGGSTPIRLAYKISRYTTPAGARGYFERTIRNRIEVGYVVGVSTVSTAVTMLMPAVAP